MINQFVNHINYRRVLIRAFKALHICVILKLVLAGKTPSHERTGRCDADLRIDLVLFAKTQIQTFEPCLYTL